jgi:putative RNA 2'-phosphotransferase
MSIEMKDLERISKRMSYVLRHAPQTAGLTLDENGWVTVDRLAIALGLDRPTIDWVVANNDKRRFAIQTGPDGVDRIRASQGHTVKIDLGLAPVPPPDTLFHGTHARNRDSIRADGLVKRQRQHVHLSKDEQTAFAVGQRRGPDRVVILRIDAARMARDGYAFYRSANGVWLTDHVPSDYIEE